MTSGTILKRGDFLLTRNAEPKPGNPSPGHWNHCAIALGDDQIIEAQAAPYNQVILSDWKELYTRYPEILILRPPNDYADAIAAKANALFGSPYRKVVLRITRRRKVGENCVSVARRAYKYAAGWDPKWKIPDHLLGSAHTGFLQIAGQKLAG